MTSLPTAVDVPADRRVTADVCIIGAGVAGLFGAVCLPAGLDTVIVDKGAAGRSGSSPWAQGGLAAALGEDDDPALHAVDTIRAGDGLCDPAAVAVLAREAPDRVRDLLTMGARFDGSAGTGTGDVAALDLAREGGQQVARSVHHADATGAELVRVLREQAAPRVDRLEGLALALAGDRDGRVVGAWVLADGAPVLVHARATLLAAGGCGALFAATTNRPGTTGDGVALAYRAGAAVRDLEFVQFHPTGLAVEGHFRFLLTEALRGAGARLRTADGSRFMTDRHEDAELAPRHIVSQAILDQAGGTAWLDATHLGETRLAREFPTVLEGVRSHGFDLASEPVPVTPAAHYMVGGVRTDLHGRTSVPGLYAAGEVASTGVHGANRMAGNSLSEAMVFGRRSARALLTDLSSPPGEPEPGEPGLAPARGGPDPETLARDLAETMWQGVGPVRDADSLAAACERLAELRGRLGPRSRDRDLLELDLALTTARLIAESAALRPESRGGHHRTDRPGADPVWGEVHVERVRGPA